LPIALSHGCVMRRDVSKGSVLTVDDVQRAPGRLAEALWCEQNALWLEGSRERSSSLGNLRTVSS
jgi:predicted homoserine dehydrogenase-like protein